LLEVDGQVVKILGDRETIEHPLVLYVVNILWTAAEMILNTETLIVQIIIKEIDIDVGL
jgi:hypothetical protein